ncbi:MAG: zinc protease [Actinomycetota bacterium]|nr:zinc protease [Actinomycetota bacterium]
MAATKTTKSKKAPAKKAVAKKAKAPAKKATAKQATAKKAPAKRAPAKKATAKKATAKKATAPARRPAKVVTGQVAKLTFPIERATLSNGLKVVLAPDRSSPAVNVAVYYDVGFRSEPQGRTGFAHLFEHLMFEGSASLEKLQHAKLVQGNGGTFNGSTNTDYTNYFEELPSTALEMGLFLEADRMRAVRLNEETLQNQIAVVKEEIRVNVLNRPYGGFPWILLPPVLFDTFNNAHNGYGSFEDLESATVADAADFFKKYYAPANAVLSVTGDFAVDKAMALVEKHFGDLPRRPAPKRPSFAEDAPKKEKRVTHHDPMAPAPAVAVGYRVPDPTGRNLKQYLAAVMLTEVLTDGEASRLYQRLVKEDRLASHAFGMIGLFGNPFEVRDPTPMQLVAYYQGGGPDGILKAIDEEVEKVASDLDEVELERVRTSWLSGYLQQADNFMYRGLHLAVLEQQRGKPSLLNDLPAEMARVRAADVREAASQWLNPKHRAVVDIQPGSPK